ncbi:MAG: hypothetical protein HY619_05040 [Thaumarchaeota archaeon]|nr:hypothetical protein [Nitrososphaerota archaeon]
MSIKVHQRLLRLLIMTTHEERQAIDREIEARTKVYCDKGIDKISDQELRVIVDMVRRRKARKIPEVYA